jgi:hypothetical protein
MSQLEVNKVIPQSGTTLTLGESGDTITVPSGATLDASNATLTLPDDSVTTAKLAYDPNAFRNIVINGNMQIAQRSTSVASITTTGYYTVDRFTLALNTLGTWTMSQSTDVPSGYGFASSLKLDCTTADASPSAGDYMILQQLFEGQNLQYLKKGTANALPLTASFWVKSTKTGTFILELYDQDNTRQISKSYTVSVSNTWEFKTVTFAGDTTGAFDNNNATSLQFNFWLGAGSNFTSGTLNTSWASAVSANEAVGQVNIADNTANDFLITGVQLEAGEQASGFEFMPIDTNLGRCQRYYQLIAQGVGGQISTAFAYNATQVNAYIPLITTMRTLPSLDITTGSSFYRYTAIETNFNFSSLVLDATQNTRLATIASGGGVSGLTGGSAGFLQGINASSYLALSAEL